MIVLSLFDGISGAQLALKRAGIKVDKYYASEIDKYAISITQKNFPDTIQLGDITKWHEWNIEKPDLIIGGSPCQGFSFAGKQLNFEDKRSKLFFQFIDILKHYNPKYFLLENVKMKKEYQQIISDLLEIEPVEINSALVSAQNRKRLYWCNWNVEKPEDKGILLKDIIEQGIVDRDKSYCIDANYFKGGNLEQYFDKSRRQLVFCGSMRGRRINNRGVRDDYNFNIKPKQRIEIKEKPKSNCLSTVQKDNLIGCIQTGIADINGKSPTLSTCQGGHREPKITLENMKWRKLTPLECERLQTYPDNYTETGLFIPNIKENKCVKQHVVAIIENKGKFYVGHNKCDTPQETCPRQGMKTGEGYHLCSLVCNQKNHAEVSACLKADKNAYGGTLYLIGHTYCCDNCKRIMNEFGIKNIIIGEYPKIKISNTQRYKALGNSFTVDVIAHILKQIK